MAASEPRTSLVDQWLFRIKNHRFLAVLILLGLCVGGIASFGESVGKLVKLLNDGPPASASAPTTSIRIGTIDNRVVDARTSIDASSVTIHDNRSGTAVTDQPPTSIVLHQPDASRDVLNASDARATPGVGLTPDSRSTVTDNAKSAANFTTPIWSAGPSAVLRLSDGPYVLRVPLEWSPHGALQSDLPRVVVPAGFVATLEGFPRGLIGMATESLGERFTLAMVLLDYLYWSQTTSLVEANQIFMLAAQDLGIPPDFSFGMIRVIPDQGVQIWMHYQTLKYQGEKRFLKNPPESSEPGWNELSKTQAVFSDRQL